MARKAKKRRYSSSSGSDVASEMRRYKKGTAKSGRGGRVKSRKQAIAVGLSKARKKGKKVPKKASTRKSAKKMSKKSSRTSSRKSSKRKSSKRSR
ncbi:DUF6496 domain-containing protein [Bradyrhizobium sp. DASA03068]|uniref:DUF6496 domain-containing protein n=1 Tax=Bradyrhizobium sp. BLXBL-01 TaxID=3395915 RepID=UPI003F716CEF